MAIQHSAKPAWQAKTASVKDVAKAAGVSVATVSRAFNLPERVSQTVRTSVLDVARQLGYRPNAAAKALRLQRSYMVGAIFPTTDYGLYASMLSSFQQHMSESGYLSVLLTVGFDNSKIFESVRQLIERGVEGVMIVGRIDDQRLSEYLLEHRIPVVSTYSALVDAPFPSVGIDNYAATAEVMTHLLALGHRRFAMLSGPAQGNDRQQARRRAFEDALVRAGIEGKPLIFEDPKGYSLAFASGAFRSLVEEHPDVTAIVCNSDYYGMAVLSEAKRLGIDVPGKISVTGFDDQEFSAILDPPLTTISVQSVQMGKDAAATLLETLENRKVGPSQKFGGSLVVRSSTSQPVEQS